MLWQQYKIGIYSFFLNFYVLTSLVINKTLYSEIVENKKGYLILTRTFHKWVSR